MSTKMKKLKFIVELQLPDGATPRECEEYVRDAVYQWCGQFRPPGAHDDDDPGDPLRYVGYTSKVHRLTIGRARRELENLEAALPTRCAKCRKKISDGVLCQECAEEETAARFRS